MKSDITINDLNQLQQLHDRIEKDFPNWKNRIEVHYVPIEGIKDFRNKAFQMGNISPGEPLHMISSGKDWIDEWFCVQEYAIILYGIDKKDFIPYIEKSEFISTIRNYALNFRERIETCKESCYSQAYAILTVCRALYTIKTGDQISKPGAAKWAMDFLPEYYSLIENALIWRRERDINNRDPHETYGMAEKFIKDVLSRFIDIT